MKPTDKQITEEAGWWHYKINYGPEGEENYANVFNASGEFVGNLKIHHAREIVGALNEAALSAQDGAVGVKALDLSNLLKHAFISGRESVSGASSFHVEAWVEYDPEECPAYHRISAALTSPSPVQGAGAEPVALRKRPVAFRVKDFADDWILFHDEEAALKEAEATGALMQGLYVRDGSPPPDRGDEWEKTLLELAAYADEKAAMALAARHRAQTDGDTVGAAEMERERHAYSNMTKRIQDALRAAAKGDAQ